MKNLYKDKKILVTGGTGFVGQALVRELLKYSPKVIRIFSRDDSKQFMMRHAFDDDRRLRWLIGDVRDYTRLAAAFEDIDIVFHAAALKHVPACEYNPFEAVKTNVIGIQNVIEAAIANNVDKVINMSTDKATAPSNVMGATKLLGEKLIATASKRRPDRRTKFASVRFGNVLGSRGSVIPLFVEQIKKGGPLTITDNKMQRFVITMSGAVQLLLKTAGIMNGGEVCLFKMPVIKVEDLADLMIEKYAEKKKITKKYVGLRHGETLDEDLLTEEESRRALEAADMYLILPTIGYKERFAEYKKMKRVPEGFRYSTGDQKPITRKELKILLEEAYAG